VKTLCSHFIEHQEKLRISRNVIISTNGNQFCSVPLHVAKKWGNSIPVQKMGKRRSPKLALRRHRGIKSVLPPASHFDRVGLDATHITFALPIMDKYLDYDKNDLNDVMMMASSTDWGRGGQFRPSKEHKKHAQKLTFGCVVRKYATGQSCPKGQSLAPLHHSTCNLHWLLESLPQRHGYTVPKL